MQGQGQNNIRNGTIVPSVSSEQAQQTGSHSLRRNIDLNVVASENNQPLLSLEFFRTAGTSSGERRIRNSNDSSSGQVMIHSGSARYLAEENINREGLPTNGRNTLLCKRRAPEVPSQPINNVTNTLTAVGSSNNSTHPIVHAVAGSSINDTHPIVPAAGSSYNGAHSIIPAAALPNQIQVDQVDNFQRNTRMRTVVGQQNVGRVSLSTWNSNNYNVQVRPQVTGHQRSPTFSSSVGPFPISTPPQMPVMENQTLLPQQQIVGVPNQFQASQLPSHYWNRQPQPMSPFDSSPLMIPTPPNMPQNLNLISRNQAYLRREVLMQSPPTIFSSSRYHPSSSMTDEQYVQWLQYEMRTYYPLYTGASPFVRGMDFSMRGGNPMPLQMWSEAIGHRFPLASLTSHTVQFQFVAQRRRRLVYQDAMIVGRSILNGINLFEDTSDYHHRGLDVDNMSYEELLDLEDQIGDASTGLSERVIRAMIISTILNLY